MKKYTKYRVLMVYKGVIQRTFYVDASSLTHAKNKAKKFGTVAFSSYVLSKSKFYPFKQK